MCATTAPTSAADSVGENTVLEQRILRLGIVRDHFAAIQIDLNAATRRVGNAFQDATLCDHNCTVEVNGKATGGSYTCPAAISLNRGLAPKDLAGVDLLLRGLETTISGIRHSRKHFLEEIFPQYCQDYGIPGPVASILRRHVDTDRLEVNLFGGSPEVHPGILELIDRLKQLGVDVHLTTTGRRLMDDPEFFEALLKRPPALLGLGADDFESVEQISRLATLPLDALRAESRQVPWYHGQRKKIYEAMYLVRMSQSRAQAGFPPVLLNMVVHPGNASKIHDILDALTYHAPAALQNPYPVQTAFLYEESALADHLERLAELVDTVIDEHVKMANGQTPRWRLAPRMHYWLMLKAALNAPLPRQEIANLIGGKNLWRCYTKAGAGRCVQVASSRAPKLQSAAPGGHLGCYWNADTVTDPRQIWDMQAEDVRNWVFGERQVLGTKAQHACSGCAFPRMSFDCVSLELGLGDMIRPAYLALRRQYVGY